MEQLPRLPKHFFEENPVYEHSPAAFTDFLIQTQDNQGLQAYLDRAAEKNPSMGPQILEEAAYIKGLTEPGDLVDYLRKCKYMDNEGLLRRRLLECQPQTMPLLLRRFRTSSQDAFLENAVMVLVRAEEAWLLELYRDYDQIRDAYARSMACYLFGKRGLAQTAELLLAEYRRFEQDDSDEGYEDGPLLGLYLLYGEQPFVEEE